MVWLIVACAQGLVGAGHPLMRSAYVHAAPRRAALAVLRGGASIAASAALGEHPATIATVATQPIEGQKPGTSGVRKRTAVFMAPNYVENLVQAFFDTLGPDALAGSTLVVGGDGRYFCAEAAQTILRMALANGVARCWVGVGGLIATPAVSALIRERDGGGALAGIVLTASHNPGGPDKDFGLKFNCENGGPAPEGLTDKVFARTKAIAEYRIARGTPDVDLSAPGLYSLSAGGQRMEVEVVDSTLDYAALAQRCFDLPLISQLVRRQDFSLLIDAMHGAGARRLPRPSALFRLRAAHAARCRARLRASLCGGLHSVPPSCVCSRAVPAGRARQARRLPRGLAGQLRTAG